MQLLLRRNYSNVEIDLNSREFVSVKTIDNTGWEHMQIAGFISLPESKMFDPILERKVACNAWRHTDKDQWERVSKDEYLVAIEVQHELLIVLDAVRPHIKQFEALSQTTDRKKAPVLNLFGERKSDEH